MNINRYITSVLSGLDLPVCEGLYQGKSTEYIYWVLADDRGGDFGEDEPLSDLTSVQVYYVCPWDRKYSDMKNTIRNLLKDSGFTYPRVIDLSDVKERTRRICFECEIESDEYEEVSDG